MSATRTDTRPDEDRGAYDGPASEERSDGRSVSQSGGPFRGRPGVLVLNGTPPTAWELARIPDDAFVVAADGGANVLADAHLWPHVLVGDLESVRPQVLASIEARGVLVERHPEAKADIDGVLALERLLDEHPSSVLVLGALGGRSAMAFAHLEILRRCLARKVPAHIVAAGEELCLLGAGDRLQVAGAGRVFNLLPDTPEVTFSVTGSVYDVRDLREPYGSTRGVSNAVRDSVASVTVSAGRAVVVVEAAPSA